MEKGLNPMLKSFFYSLFLGSILATMVPADAFGHGWAGYEQGAKAHGMGGAFTGLADDPTAVYYNPAGMMNLEGTQASIGAAVAIPRGKFKSYGTSGMQDVDRGDETSLEKQTFIIPNFYLTSKLSEKFSLGLGVYTIYGLGFEWPDSFEGRFAPGGIKGELKTMTLSPVAAYQISRDLSLSVGGRFERADLSLEDSKFIAPGIEEVRSKISGDDYAFGWYSAIFYRVSKNLSAGLNYRSEMKHSFRDLDVEFFPQIDAVGPIPVGINNTKADLDVTLPQFFSLGVAWSVGSLTLTADAYWWNWSVLDELNFRLDTPVAGQASLRTPMNWKDTWTWAIGAQYKIYALGREISLRAGFMYEECPVPDETVMPVGYLGDNLLYNIGFGTPIGPLYSDFYFSYVHTKDRRWNNAYSNAPNPGGGPVTGEFNEYRTFIIGANFRYVF
jgi:long-chain fatty acid transport protein